MHPSQRKVIRYVEETVNFFAASLMDEYDLEEEEALELIAGVPNFTDRIQEGDLEGLYEDTRKIVRVVNSPDNPKELYPNHPAYMPPMVFKETFNDHMSQAMAPYVAAIAKKVAKDRGLAEPDEKEIKEALKQTDWAKAAYEAKKMPKYPGLAKIKDFFIKYIGKPIDKATDKIGLSRIFALATAGLMMHILWSTFSQQVEDIGSPPFKAAIKYGDWQEKGFLNRAARAKQKRFRAYGR